MLCAHCRGSFQWHLAHSQLLWSLNLMQSPAMLPIVHIACSTRLCMLESKRSKNTSNPFFSMIDRHWAEVPEAMFVSIQQPSNCIWGNCLSLISSIRIPTAPKSIYLCIFYYVSPYPMIFLAPIIASCLIKGSGWIRTFI